ncbi:hypothetical protein MCEL_07650 [Mycolicibacterium celeriflavum]|uniref:Uncharacterized protein n=1 Tax=Mycolicibacterium celeriflavum TaxID=1249101 RepID=A0A7I7RDP4_MYCCF|nr:hypothetical protein MCEL_07650 [Mycolicibacterium celeriflavum]
MPSSTATKMTLRRCLLISAPPDSRSAAALGAAWLVMSPFRGGTFHTHIVSQARKVTHPDESYPANVRKTLQQARRVLRKRARSRGKRKLAGYKAVGGRDTHCAA